MSAFDYSVATELSVNEAATAVEARSRANGFRVLHTHDIAATLAEKGFDREPVKIVEICNARYANLILQKDVKLALMLPCPISIYKENAKTYISALRPTAITGFYPEAGIKDLAAEVEEVVTRIVDEAARTER